MCEIDQVKKIYEAYNQLLISHGVKLSDTLKIRQWHGIRRTVEACDIGGEKLAQFGQELAIFLCRYSYQKPDGELIEIPGFTPSGCAQLGVTLYEMDKSPRWSKHYYIYPDRIDRDFLVQGRKIIPPPLSVDIPRLLWLSPLLDMHIAFHPKGAGSNFF